MRASGFAQDWHEIWGQLHRRTSGHRWLLPGDDTAELWALDSGGKLCANFKM